MPVSKKRKKAGKPVKKNQTKLKEILKVNRPLKGKKLKVSVEYTKRFKIRWWIFNRLMWIACKVVKCDAIETQFVSSESKQ